MVSEAISIALVIGMGVVLLVLMIVLVVTSVSDSKVGDRDGTSMSRSLYLINGRRLSEHHMLDQSVGKARYMRTARSRGGRNTAIRTTDTKGTEDHNRVCTMCLAHGVGQCSHPSGVFCSENCNMRCTHADEVDADHLVCVDCLSGASATSGPVGMRRNVACSHGSEHHMCTICVLEKNFHQGETCTHSSEHKFCTVCVAAAKTAMRGQADAAKTASGQADAAKTASGQADAAKTAMRSQADAAKTAMRSQADVAEGLSGMCMHGGLHSGCQVCAKTDTCIHGTPTDSCVVCTMTDITKGVCEHGHTNCSVCLEANLCIHGVVHSDCHTCIFHDFCVHGKGGKDCTICCDHGPGTHKVCTLCRQESCDHNQADKVCVLCVVEEGAREADVCDSCGTNAGEYDKYARSVQSMAGRHSKNGTGKLAGYMDRAIRPSTCGKCLGQGGRRADRQRGGSSKWKGYAGRNPWNSMSDGWSTIDIDRDRGFRSPEERTHSMTHPVWDRSASSGWDTIQKNPYERTDATEAFNLDHDPYNIHAQPWITR